MELVKASGSALSQLGERKGNDTDWAQATVHHDQIRPGVWEWWVAWNDGTSDRRMLFRAQRKDEVCCDASGPNGSVCCLPVDHAGPHVPTDASDAAIGIILAP